MTDRNGAFTSEQPMTIFPSSEIKFDYPSQTKDGRWIIGYDNWEPIIVDCLDDELAAVVAAAVAEDKKTEETQTLTCVYNDDNNQYFSSGIVEKDGIDVDESENKLAISTVATCANEPIDWTLTDDIPVEAGVAGLTNLGNTCFINAGLQCLFNNWRLIDYFLDYDINKLLQEKELNSVAKCFIALHQNVWSKERKERVMKNIDFKECLGQRFVQFKDYRQHDCQEFLALLLAALHDELKEEQQQQQEIEEMQSIEEEKSTVSSPSSVSSCSSDLKDEDDIRKQPIPDTITSFKIPASLVKETKTSNTNMMKEDDERNNQLNFNSVKFPMVRRKDTFVDNLGGNNLYLTDGECNPLNKGCKRIKQTNLTNDLQQQQQRTTVASSVKPVPSSSKPLPSSNSTAAATLTLKSSSLSSPSCSISEDTPAAITEATYSSSSTAVAATTTTSFKRQKTSEETDDDEGSSEWRQYLGFNKTSIIVDTFQGQFKSTITCFTCHHISVTYEPFMYLALPIPHALERQLVVTLVNSLDYSYCSRDVSNGKPIKYLLHLHKYDKVSKVIDTLNELLKSDGQLAANETLNMCIAEVQDNYITKLFDEDAFLRNVDDKEKSVYAFIVASSSVSLPFSSSSSSTSSLTTTIVSVLTTTNSTSTSTNSTATTTIAATNSSETNNSSTSTSTSSSTTTAAAPRSDLWTWQVLGLNPPVNKIVCNICLEDKSSTEILLHDADCNCMLCPPCLDNMISHYCKDKNTFSCPICTISLVKEKFYPMESDVKVNTVTPRNLQIPLLFRVDQQNGSNSKYKLLSYPLVIEVISVINGSQLYEIVNRLVPYPCPYSLHFVDQQGQRCSRCFWSSDCSGCEISRYSDVTINYDDSIAVEFESLEFAGCDYFQENIIEHRSMVALKSSNQQCLTLNDCLTEFSQSEVLDEDNPWYCPVCLSNQRANKSLSIWRCPDTLMVYLKRFIFHEMQSIKVDDPVCFPLDELDMSSFVKGPSNGHLYTLQSFVCHSGGINSGHYTAFSKNSSTNEWLYFNDETVTKQEPLDKDERAYILFYQRPKETKVDINKSTTVNNHLKNPTKVKCVVEDEVAVKCNGFIESEEMIIA